MSVREVHDSWAELETTRLAPSIALASAGFDKRAIKSLLAAGQLLDLEREHEGFGQLGTQVLSSEDYPYPVLLICLPDQLLVIDARRMFDPVGEW